MRSEEVIRARTNGPIAHGERANFPVPNAQQRLEDQLTVRQKSLLYWTHRADGKTTVLLLAVLERWFAVAGIKTGQPSFRFI